METLGFKAVDRCSSWSLAMD